MSKLLIPCHAKVLHLQFMTCRFNSVDVILHNSRTSDNLERNTRKFDILAGNRKAMKTLPDCGIWISIQQAITVISCEEAKLDFLIDLSGIMSSVFGYQKSIGNNHENIVLQSLLLRPVNCLHEISLSGGIFTLCLGLVQNTPSSGNGIKTFGSSEGSTSHLGQETNLSVFERSSNQAPLIVKKMAPPTNISMQDSSKSLVSNKCCSMQYFHRKIVSAKKSDLLRAHKVNKLLSLVSIGGDFNMIFWEIQGGLIILETLSLPMAIDNYSLYLHCIGSLTSVAQQHDKSINLAEDGRESYNLDIEIDQGTVGTSQQAESGLPDAFDISLSHFALVLALENESGGIQEIVLEVDIRLTFNLRASGLQVLSAMVWFMGEFTHISVEFDNVVSVVLENNGDIKQDSQNENSTRLYSWKVVVNAKGEVNVPMEDAVNPGLWSRVCIQNMAKLAKEGTTVRRVLESLFRYFDNSNLWSPYHGLALSVLLDTQSIIENAGQNTHLLLSILVKHLDHKNVLKNPNMQLDIVGVITHLAQQTRVQQSVAIIGALSDMMRHLRKSIHCSIDDSNLGAEVIQWNQKYRMEVDECLVQLTIKISDAGPVLDTMAVLLENMSNITVMARTLIAAVYRTSQIVASIPNLSYQNKAFPEALFHQLLLAMVHADPETRVGAHRIFSVVLVPSSVCPQPSSSNPPMPKSTNIQRMLSRNVSVFSSSAALFEKLEKKQLSSEEDSQSDRKSNDGSVLNRLKSSYSRTSSRKLANNPSMMNRLKSSYSRVTSVKRPQLSVPVEENVVNSSDNQQVFPIRLSTHQITLSLSSIWVQSIYPLNTPENFEAIAHTYCLVLLVARSKNSSHEALVQSFQLAFSLRSISLNKNVKLQASRRMSLFTLATSMIIFTSKAYNILSLISITKMTLTDKTVDPFLTLINDSKLQATVDTSDQPSKVYGSK